MDTPFTTAQRIAAPFLRISLGIILLWIGALRFVEPSPVVELLGASLSFLASARFVYVLGVFEVLAALALILGIGVRYVGLLVLALFAGTLTIFDLPGGDGLPVPQHGRGVLAEGSRPLRGNVRGDRGRLREGARARHGGATGSTKG